MVVFRLSSNPHFFSGLIMNIFVTEKPEHGKREEDGRCTYCKLIWPVWSPDFEPARRVVYLLENLTRPSNSQPRSVSNEERTGTVGPQQVNLAGRRLLGLRVGCLSPCLTLLSLSGSICLSFPSRCLAHRPCIYPTVLCVSIILILLQDATTMYLPPGWLVGWAGCFFFCQQDYTENYSMKLGRRMGLGPG